VLSNLLQCLFAICLAYGIGSTLIKLAVLALYWRIFPTRTVQLGAYILGSAAIAWTIAIDLVTIFQCWPVSYQWDKTLNGTCSVGMIFYFGNSIPNCVLDAAILALPVHEVLSLRMSMRRKAAIGSLFLLGGM
jgi:hypothetical protein